LDHPDRIKRIVLLVMCDPTGLSQSGHADPDEPPEEEQTEKKP
jgi:hypothetical protein